MDLLSGTSALTGVEVTVVAVAAAAERMAT